MVTISFLTSGDFDRVSKEDWSPFERLETISDMCRFNALSAVKLAGSGHLGSSLSSMELFVWLYFHHMNVVELGVDHPDRDIFFSSKGHDCPGMYSVLMARGILPYEKLLKLRRLGGLDGHPDIHIPSVEANSGSLGMGISKAKGMALGKKLQGRKGRVYVMTGDGELQEGQIWESLQTTAHQKVENVTAIVDRNQIQTDMCVSDIIGLGDLEQKFRSFGWHAVTCNGHDFSDLDRAFREADAVRDRPKVIIADTVKGKGVSFMEGPRALEEGKGMYPWHAGAPADDVHEAATREVLERVNLAREKRGLPPLSPEIVEKREPRKSSLKATAEKVVTAYGEALLELGGKRKDLVVLDGDLSEDCGLRPFEKAYPDRFIENGIAEQDMVSTAGGLALQGLLPVVNSFGSFLSSRANEQIYNNVGEKTKIIYACHYAGLIPAGPGKSHQSVRDISLFGALPRCAIVEGCNGAETKMLVNWCVEEAEETCMIRLVISPSPRTIQLPAGYELRPGRGVELRPGKDGILFSSGPVMLHEALKASELLEKEGVGIAVVNMPWLNRVDPAWFDGILADHRYLFSLDNHSPVGGLGDTLLNALDRGGKRGKVSFAKFAVEGDLACGTPPEALRAHRLDGESLADRIREAVGRKPS